MNNKPELILLRYGELTLKGKNRHYFENRILNHVQRITQAFPAIRLKKVYGRIYLQLNGEDFETVAERLQQVFGLSSFSPVWRCDLTLEAIMETALHVLKLEIPSPRTFKVNVKRAYKNFPLNSQQLNQRIGGFLLKNIPGLRVDVHEPDVQLRVEVREEGAYVFLKTIPGLGGFPVGSNGKAMLMLSGGIDSPVAGWLTMKRGVEIEAVHFHSFPYTSERAQQKVIDLTRKLAPYAGSIKLHMVPFTEIQTRLNQLKRDHLLITLMRRAMMRITEKLAIKNDAQAIVTGESIGQVASQTLTSLHVIGNVVDLPIIRPLVTMDKLEIVSIAEKIDTYSISILPYEDCCTLFVPKSPSTKPNLQVVQKIERNIPELDRLIDEAVEATELIKISENEPEAIAELF